MAQQIMLSTDKNRITVAPGAKTELRATIQNLTTLVDDASFSVVGVDESWVQIVPQHVPVFAQGDASVRVILQPPADPRKSVAGVYPIRIVGSLQELADQKVESVVDFEIQFGGDYRIELGAGTASSNQEASFPFKVHNDGNAPLTLRCSGEDAQNLYWYKFDPFQFSVAAGDEATIALSIRTRQPLPGSQKVVFTLKTQGEWTIAGMSSIEAAAKQINGQWEQGVQPVLNLSITPSRIEDSQSGNYHLVVGNPGQATETIILEGRSANGQLAFRFEPPQLTLRPQGQGAVMATVWPVAAFSGQQDIDFWIAARPTGQTGVVRSASVQAAFVRLQAAQAKRQRPSWILAVIIAVLVLILICVVGILIYYAFSGYLLGSLGANQQSLFGIDDLTRRIIDGSIGFNNG
jgi:hypothetical protein